MSNKIVKNNKFYKLGKQYILETYDNADQAEQELKDSYVWFENSYFAFGCQAGVKELVIREAKEKTVTPDKYFLFWGDVKKAEYRESFSTKKALYNFIKKRQHKKAWFIALKGKQIDLPEFMNRFNNDG